MVLIFKGYDKALSIKREIDSQADLPSKSGNTTEAVNIMPNNDESRWAIDVYQYEDREWIDEIKSKADEVVEGLSEDWFEENL